MRGPEQRQRHGQSLTEQQAANAELCWCERGMRGVICGGTRARSAEIANEAQVGSQEQTCEEPPGCVGPAVEQDGGDEEGGAFAAQQEVGAPFTVPGSRMNAPVSSRLGFR